jgi:uncharacterized protein
VVHSFSLHGRHLAFDVESGSLHEFDDFGAEVLAVYLSNGGLRPEPAALPDHPDAESTADAIDRLIADGTLFAETAVPVVEDLYPEDSPIKAMCLHVSHDCNLRCTYCFAGTGDFGTGRRIHLDLQTGKDAVEFLIRASKGRRNLDIDFFGGEPLLNFGVVEDLTAYCELRSKETGLHIRLTLTTNALLLDETRIAFLDAHMDNLVLSLDGRPEAHDRMRPFAGGRGSYDLVAKRILEFAGKRGDRSYYVRGTFTRHNLDFAADVAHIESLGIGPVSLEPVVAPPEADYAIRNEDLPAILEEYERLALHCLDSFQKGSNLRFFHFEIDLEGGPCAYKRLKGCGAGAEYIAVTPEGDIYPCHQFVGMPEFRMGNVHEASGDTEYHLDPELRARFRKLLVPDKDECRTCWARYFCSGGCAANAYHASGRIDGLYDIGCELQKKRLECALWLKAAKAETSTDS